MADFPRTNSNDKSHAEASMHNPSICLIESGGLDALVQRVEPKDKRLNQKR